MSKMGSHDPFGHLQHKLWQKERSRVKLAIWFPITKRQELIRLPCMQMECNTPLEISQRKLQLCFRPHPNRRSKQEVMAPQNWKSLTLIVSRFSFGSPETKKAIWMGASQIHVENTIWGKVVASPLLCTFPWGLHPNDFSFLGLSSGSPEIAPVETPATLEPHNFASRPWIEVWSQAKLYLSLRDFQ